MQEEEVKKRYLKERVLMGCWVNKGEESPSAIRWRKGSKSAWEESGTKEVKRDSKAKSSWIWLTLRSPSHWFKYSTPQFRCRIRRRVCDWTAPACDDTCSNQSMTSSSLHWSPSSPSASIIIRLYFPKNGLDSTNNGFGSSPSLQIYTEEHSPPTNVKRKNTLGFTFWVKKAQGGRPSNISTKLDWPNHMYDRLLTTKEKKIKKKYLTAFKVIRWKCTGSLKLVYVITQVFVSKSIDKKKKK